MILDLWRGPQSGIFDYSRERHNVRSSQRRPPKGGRYKFNGNGNHNGTQPGGGCATLLFADFGAGLG
jgi:hypothetical protein